MGFPDLTGDLAAFRPRRLSANVGRTGAVALCYTDRVTVVKEAQVFQHRFCASRKWIALTAFAFCSPAFAQAPAHVDFQREIRPILSENCFQCHGPDSASRQAGMRLDRREGAPIVPGNAAASLLYQRI